MMTFIQSELIKLKHSKIFLLTVLGALTFPFLLYLSLISGTADGFESMLRACNQFTGSMFNIVLFAIVVSYIFGREYTEHTLKTMMTIPISRGKFILGKYLMFFIWTFIITTITFTGTVLAAYFGGISDITLSAGLNSYKEMLISVFLLCLSFSPFVFLSLVMPNMVYYKYFVIFKFHPICVFIIDCAEHGSCNGYRSCIQHWKSHDFFNQVCPLFSLEQFIPNRSK